MIVLRGLLCGLFSVVFYVNALGQAPPPPPPGGGGNIAVTAFSNTPTDLPMGSQFELDCTHGLLVDPKYQWSYTCDGVAWNQNSTTHRKKLLQSCFVKPAETTYKITVTDGQANGSDTVDVQWHAPDYANAVISKIAGENPTPGQSVRHQQYMRVNLKWNNIDLGPCADLCYKERVSVRYLPKYRKLFKAFQNFNLEYIPNPCIPASADYKFYGNLNLPNEVTMHWKSPFLYDRNWWTFTWKDLINFSTIPDGTVIATRRHQYFFDGTECGGHFWGPLLLTVNLECRVHEIKRNGNPIPIAGTNPVRNTRVAKWFVTGQSFTVN